MTSASNARYIPNSSESIDEDVRSIQPVCSRDLEDIEVRTPSMIEKKRFCSSRTTLILLLIIIGLFSLIALIIGIYSLVLAVNRNTNEPRTVYVVAAVDAAVAATSN